MRRRREKAVAAPRNATRKRSTETSIAAANNSQKLLVGYLQEMDGCHPHVTQMLGTFEITEAVDCEGAGCFSYTQEECQALPNYWSSYTDTTLPPGCYSKSGYYVPLTILEPKTTVAGRPVCPLSSRSAPQLPEERRAVGC